MRIPLALSSAHLSKPLLPPVTRPCPPCRYAILAPNVLPKGFVDARAATEKLMDAIKLDEGEYRLGFTKVREINVPPYTFPSSSTSPLLFLCACAPIRWTFSYLFDLLLCDAQ